MIEVIRTSETSAYHETTGRNIRQGSNLQIHLIPRLELRTVLKPLHDVVCLLRCDTMWTCMWIWYQRFWGTYRLHRLGLTPVTWLNEKCFFLIMSSVTMDTWSDRFFMAANIVKRNAFHSHVFADITNRMWVCFVTVWDALSCCRQHDPTDSQHLLNRCSVNPVVSSRTGLSHMEPCSSELYVPVLKTLNSEQRAERMKWQCRSLLLQVKLGN